MSLRFGDVFIGQHVELHALLCNFLPLDDVAHIIYTYDDRHMWDETIRKAFQSACALSRALVIAPGAQELIDFASDVRNFFSLVMLLMDHQAQPSTHALHDDQHLLAWHEQKFTFTLQHHLRYFSTEAAVWVVNLNLVLPHLVERVTQEAKQYFEAWIAFVDETQLHDPKAKIEEWFKFAFTTLLRLHSTFTGNISTIDEAFAGFPNTDENVGGVTSTWKAIDAAFMSTCEAQHEHRREQERDFRRRVFDYSQRRRQRRSWSPSSSSSASSSSSVTHRVGEKRKRAADAE